jgi:2-dehydropantoate 2-reductase
VLVDGGRVLVLGTGALACAIGARLARAGTHVTLAGTWPEALEAIAARGIRVHEGGRRWAARVSAVPIDARLEPFPLALVLVKSHRTARTAAVLAGSLAVDGLAVTLQNGLGNREALEATLGRQRVAAGAAFLGASVLGPGEVEFHPGRVVLDSACGDERVRWLARRLEQAGLAVEVSPAFAPVFWRKLAVNCAINAATALHGVANGALLGDARLRRTLEDAARETGAVATARGVLFEGDPAEAAVEVARATASNRSSMLQDLARGARTEVDSLNGAVAHEGHRLGVPTPVNAQLFRLVRAREGRPLAQEAHA